MKKIALLGLVLALFAGAASAQRKMDGVRPDQRRFETHSFTHGERAKMHQNHRQYKRMEGRFKRDGRISHSERKKLYKMKRHNRSQAYRLRHNRYKKVI